MRKNVKRSVNHRAWNLSPKHEQIVQTHAWTAQSPRFVFHWLHYENKKMETKILVKVEGEKEHFHDTESHSQSYLSRSKSKLIYWAWSWATITVLQKILRSYNLPRLNGSSHQICFLNYIHGCEWSWLQQVKLNNYVHGAHHDPS